MPVLERWTLRLAGITGFCALGIPLLGFLREGGRQKGTQAGAGARFLSPPAMLAAATGFILGGAWLWRPLPVKLSAGVRGVAWLAGSLLYFPGIVLYLWGYRTLGRYFSPSSGFGAQLFADHRLVTTGPYRWVRHPMYLGVLLCASGGLLLFRTWAMALFAPFALVVIVRARWEESLLAARFGSEWEAYRRRVPGWWPRPERWGSKPLR